MITMIHGKEIKYDVSYIDKIIYVRINRIGEGKLIKLQQCHFSGNEAKQFHLCISLIK